ncbi:MAG TPA: cytochrome d ubiquinol oxidase subunit II [Streptosporangiaceae bacterium]|nr:cytochrome d ubiquinol oxidase subunit II [Streptosporangiaceae bacterium]
MALVSFWFLVIAVLWTGFFVLEGFDFGVGILHAVVGRDEPGRRAAINTIGPLWDGNEVWLITAAAAMFAAFPGWYATMFSGFYLVLVLLLLALIVRGISFEFRGKRDSATWRRSWDGLMTGGSLLAPLLIGIALGDLLHGLPVDKSQEFTGNFLSLLQPYGVYTGVTLLAICVLHGSTFLSLKTSGDVRGRARAIASAAAPVTGLIVLGFAIWTHTIAGKGVLPNPIEVAAVLAIFASAWLAHDGREGWAFAATTFAMAATVLSIFSELYPRVMVSSTNPAFNLTIHNTASGSYSLRVMTVVVVILLPVVLLYQGWTYYVFRQRVTPGDVQPPRGLGTRRPGGRLPADEAGGHRNAQTGGPPV